MSKGLLIVVTLIYGWIAIDQFLKGNPNMGIVYIGYAFANVGMILMAS